MKPRIYIDTSVFGVAAVEHVEEKAVFMQTYARRFLDLRQRYEGFISDVVAQEIHQAPAFLREILKSMIGGFPLLPVTPIALDLARLYRSRMVMPTGNESDSVHVAAAVVHRMDSLATWNLKHMANPNKLEALRLVNAGLGLATPLLCSPLEWVSSWESEEEP